MLNPEAACLPSLHSALLLLAAAGSLPFNDAQVSSVSVFPPKAFSYEAAHGAEFPSPSFWGRHKPGLCVDIECFQAGCLLARPMRSLGAPPSTRGCAVWPQSSGLWVLRWVL